jgi:hypothetical protein
MKGDSHPICVNACVINADTQVGYIPIYEQILRM